MADNKLIPFGKYKGQPVEVLSNDRNYAEWLTQQPWAKEKYPHVISVIVNNFAEPDETPEHNKLQARFLNPEFRARFAYMVLPKLSLAHLDNVEILSAQLKSPERGVVKISDPLFEVDAVDCSFCADLSLGLSISTKRNANCPAFYEEKVPIMIEVKPVVGDDYPAILRDMLTKRKSCPPGRNYRSRWVLFYESFDSLAISEDTLRQFFACQGVATLSLTQLSLTTLKTPTRREYLSQLVKDAENKLPGDRLELIRNATCI